MVLALVESCFSRKGIKYLSRMIGISGAHSFASYQSNSYVHLTSFNLHPRRKWSYT